MKIGLAKLGRTTGLDPSKYGPVGGDIDVYRSLELFANRHPNDEIRVVGRNTAKVSPQAMGLPANVTNPWVELRTTAFNATTHGEGLEVGGKTLEYTAENMKAYVDTVTDQTEHIFADLDAIIIWAGQHGTTNYPLPAVKGGKLTKPFVWSLNYGGYLLQNVNRWRAVDPEKREEIWLCPDPRNYLKMRDLKYPLKHPVLGQFAMERQLKHDRYDGTPALQSSARYIQSGLEMTPLLAPEDVEVVEGDKMFGIVINETRREVGYPRKRALAEWVLPNFPDADIRGQWSEKSKDELRIDPTTIEVADYYDEIGRWRYTLTTPPSGSGWITTKPFEMFARGVICFFHPKYDTQNAALWDAPDLLRALRVNTPAEMIERIEWFERNPSGREWIVRAQREQYEKRWNDAAIYKHIEERL